MSGIEMKEVPFNEFKERFLTKGAWLGLIKNPTYGAKGIPIFYAFDDEQNYYEWPQQNEGCFEREVQAFSRKTREMCGISDAMRG